MLLWLNLQRHTTDSREKNSVAKGKLPLLPLVLEKVYMGMMVRSLHAFGKIVYMLMVNTLANSMSFRNLHLKFWLFLAGY